MGLTVYRLYVYFVESHCNKSLRVPLSSLYPQNVHYDVTFFIFILGRIVIGDIKRLLASVSSLGCSIRTLCIRTNSLYIRTHSSRRFLIQCSTYRKCSYCWWVQTCTYRIFLLSHTEQGKFIEYKARFRGTFRDNAVLRTAVWLLRGTSWGLNATNCNSADHTKCGDRPVLIGGMFWSLDTGVRYC
jgi:hypothetical protein